MAKRKYEYAQGVGFMPVKCPICGKMYVPADLSDADLHGAYLRGADLSDADLSSADLSSAKLERISDK